MVVNGGTVYGRRSMGPTSDAVLVAALQAGDEVAFMELVGRYSSPMRRFALSFVRTSSVADEVVQDAWLAVLRGIDRFEARSSLKTWIFRIVANTAITRAKREARSVPFSSLPGSGDEPSVDPDRFLGPEDPRAPGHWATPPSSWRAQPEERLLSAETRRVIDHTIAALPDTQRLVVTLRDVEGFSAEEVSQLLDLSAGNQRVLLHRGRSKVRAALEDYLQEVTT